jgi:hypothetical protein
MGTAIPLPPFCACLACSETALPVLIFYLLKGLAQVEFCASRDRVYTFLTIYIYIYIYMYIGAAGAQLVEVLFYKPEGRGFDSRWCHWNFSLV